MKSGFGRNSRIPWNSRILGIDCKLYWRRIARLDWTGAFAKAYWDEGVLPVRSSERRGKEDAQRYAVDIASGEILMFSDVATRLPHDAVTKFLKNFHDRTVGRVSSVDYIASIPLPPL
jgi:cellulose synthase/poly-beta-1,6-N-acetylglucosamine synthase-like glycosyltransferase